jgi:Arm DNA-binding domain
MLLPIKPICPINKIRRDGTCAIFFQYCFNAKQRTLLNTGISIPPLFWSSKQLPIEYGNHVLLNEELLRLRRIVEDLVYHAAKQQIEDRISWVKANFSPSMALGDIGNKIKFDQEKKIKEKKDKLNIYYQFDEYIKSK